MMERTSSYKKHAHHFVIPETVVGTSSRSIFVIGTKETSQADSQPFSERYNAFRENLRQPLPVVINAKSTTITS